MEHRNRNRKCETWQPKIRIRDPRSGKTRISEIRKHGTQKQDEEGPISEKYATPEVKNMRQGSEKIVAKKLLDHLLDNELLYVHQYGFLPNRSTEHNLLQIVNYITQALNEGNYCIGIFLDLRKAFDVCSHEILLKKLEKMGIRGVALTWFKNYLAGRTQFVDIDGNRSDALSIDISVIQGSILGPILFLCYINDFYSATSLFSVLFADDTTGLGKGKNLRDLTLYMNSELQKIANWFRSNKMAINTAKTKFIVFRTRGKRIDPDDCNLVFNNNEIGQPEDPSLVSPITRICNDAVEKSFKLLGVLFE